MTGYRIVFNRDKMIIGWKPSNCELIQLFLYIEFQYASQFFLSPIKFFMTIKRHGARRLQ